MTYAKNFQLSTKNSLFGLLITFFVITACSDSQTSTSPNIPERNTFIQAEYLETIEYYGSAKSLREISGQISDETGFWGLDDSGNANAILRINTETGEVLQRVTVSNAENTDWEELADDAEFIYIGDFGNNRGNRQDLTIWKVSRADIPAEDGPVSVQAEPIRVSYAAQTVFETSNDHNFDCEAMISLGDELILFSKNRGDGQTYVYRVPKTPGEYSLTPVETYNVQGLVTGADMNEATGELWLTGYMQNAATSFLIKTTPSDGVFFPEGAVERHNIGVPDVTWQIESISFTPDGRLLFGNEEEHLGIPPSIWEFKF